VDAKALFALICRNAEDLSKGENWLAAALCSSICVIDMRMLHR
jgi:hypothetical protein